MKEKVQIKIKDGEFLVGDFYKVDSKKIVIMCHGFSGNRKSLGRFEKIANALNKIGYNALAFDFSGTGESSDLIMTLKSEKNDLKFVIEYIKKLGFKDIILYGHSLGSYICLLNYNKNILKIICSGSCTGPMNYDWKKYYSKEQLDFLNKNGYLISEDDDGKKIKIGKELLDCFLEINQKELCKNIKCPTLLINGNSKDDLEELELLEHSKKAIKVLPKGSKLKIIEGANHSFLDQIDELISNIINFIKN